ncbi:ATP-dependent sacrificial sulfur transferase LarE [Streptomonospora litoralis]|uniref:Asparagine synthase n=1 Tax=Streptomonospora litoralis TaxID=2498135 RepID=A0A4P6Q314_9ACTN|nr:ATP-dependent sacrificial sulfur transferase LarE [Streptomonospora litoralis]QBI54975.1 Asparagine synthase [Streptomonospora litoralis]
MSAAEAATAERAAAESADAAVERLRASLRNHEHLLVAYSGGVDSALLAYTAHRELGARALAVTAVSPGLAAAERRAARDFAAEHGIAHLEVCTDEGERPDYVANGGDRCFHCKSALFDALAPLRALLPGAAVAVGTNLDDLGDHRPGQRAAAQRGAVTPLADAGLDKAAVRRASRGLRLGTAEKPAAPCLASRVAYGDPVTPEILQRIEAAEQAVRAHGFPVARVRAHAGGTVARIEVPHAQVERAAELRGELEPAVLACGFTFCAVDLGGFSGGRLNALLPVVDAGGAAAGGAR